MNTYKDAHRTVMAMTDQARLEYLAKRLYDLSKETENWPTLNYKLLFVERIIREMRRSIRENLAQNEANEYEDY